MNNLPSENFIRRLIAYYKTHQDAECLPLWTNVYHSLRGFLLNDDIKSIQDKFNTIYINDLWGIDYNQENSWNLAPYDDCFDKCLQVMASELNIPNESREKVIKHLETITGMKLDIPIFPNRPVIKVGERNIPLRLVPCYYIAHCLRNKFTSVPNKILEIGAGTGYFPYLFTANYPTLKYYVIDLPVISVIQTYIYATMTNENNVWFHGEPERTDATLYIYSPDSINDLKEKVDVVINHNSFPEMPKKVQSKYLNKIKELLTDTGFFYSVNWEPTNMDQTPTVTACNENGFERISRNRCYIEGKVHAHETEYFEEVYKPKV